nr:MAG: Replication initiator protein A (RepA) N-terminus [Bacteriophage sp.]
MKYTIEGFSQEAALDMQTTINENGHAKTIKLDIVDLTILRWIVDFYPNMKKTIIDGTEYAWVDYTAFIEDMPLLGLSNQSLYKRCIKMVHLGILKHKTVRSKGTFSYYGFGPEYPRLVSRSNKTTNATAPTPTHAPSTEHDPWADATRANTEQSQLPIATPEPQPTPQPKKTRKTKSFDDIIDDYTNDPQTKDLLGAWLQNRKAKRAAMTDRAIQGCIGKLDKCAQESRMSVNDYLDEVVCRGWSAFFPIENYRTNGYQHKPQQQSQQPRWDLTEEELRKRKEADDEWLKNCVF